MDKHQQIKSAISTVKYHCAGTPIEPNDFTMGRSRYSEYDRVMFYAGRAHAWAMCNDKAALLRSLKDLMKLLNDEKSSH